MGFEEFEELLFEAGLDEDKIKEIIDSLETVEETAIEEVTFNEKEKPEHFTRLSNIIIKNNIYYLIDSIYIGDLDSKEEWETMIFFCDPFGNVGFPEPIYLKQYKSQIEMIENHLNIIKNPEKFF